MGRIYSLFAILRSGIFDKAEETECKLFVEIYARDMEKNLWTRKNLLKMLELFLKMNVKQRIKILMNKLNFLIKDGTGASIEFLCKIYFKCIENSIPF
jgi:hypothetical protein